MKKLLGTLLMGLFLSLPAWATVDLNSATQSELESVKGIGSAKAKAIVMHRGKNGPFQSVDDLAQVKGFGKASVVKLKDQISVSAAKPGEKK
jgi:competence protein ComEA